MLVLPAPALLTTPEALAVVGPRAFRQIVHFRDESVAHFVQQGAKADPNPRHPSGRGS